MTDHLTNIARLNDLRARVLAGEKVSEEEYRDVLIICRKMRRDAGAVEEKAAKKDSKKPSVDVNALLMGSVKGAM